MVMVIYNVPVDANPGPRIYEQMEPVMISDGWQFIETVIIGGNTHKILKSPAAGNARNLDWYLDINYPTTGIGSGFRLLPMEDYNSSTHLAFRAPVYENGGSTVIEQTYYTRHGATGFALETSWMNQNFLSVANLPVTTATFSMYFSITRNRVIGFFTNSGTRMVYAGFFKPTTEHINHAGSKLFPLVVAYPGNNGIASTSTGNSNTNMQVARAPKYPNAAFNWGFSAYTSGLTILQLGWVGVQSSNGTNEIVLAELPVCVGGTSPGPAASMLGTFDGMATGFIDSAAIRGDFVTIGTEKWYALSPTGTSTVFFRGI